MDQGQNNVPVGEQEVVAMEQDIAAGVLAIADQYQDGAVEIVDVNDPETDFESAGSDTDDEAAPDQEDWSSGLDSDTSDSSLESNLLLDKLFNKPDDSAVSKKGEYKFQPFVLQKYSYVDNIQENDCPCPRSGHRVIASESHLYCLGGYNPRSALYFVRRGTCLLFQELWALNFATNRWRLLVSGESTRMSRELASNALLLYHNVLISHGGTGYPFGETCSNDCYLYSTGAAPTARLLAVTGNLPTAQYGPCIVLHENYLYTIGGTTGFEYSCDVFRLNLSTKVWESVYVSDPEEGNNDPQGRYRHEVVYDGHHIFVLGGGTSHEVFELQRIPAFNLELNCWDYFNTLPDLSNEEDEDKFPKARKCFSCVQHKNGNGEIEAFICGGMEIEPDDNTNYLSDMWRLNLKTMQWTNLRTIELPRPLFFHSGGATPKGCMYIFGGIEYSKGNMRRRNDVYKMWLAIPKLSEICWDALSYYNETYGFFSPANMQLHKIPEPFASRVHMTRDTSEPKPPET